MKTIIYFLAFIAVMLSKITFIRILKVTIMTLIVSGFFIATPIMSYYGYATTPDSVSYRYIQLDTVNPGGTNTVSIRICDSVRVNPGPNDNPPSFLLLDIMVSDLRIVGYYLPAGAPVTINRDVIVHEYGARYLIKAGTTVTATAGDCSTKFKAYRIG